LFIISSYCFSIIKKEDSVFVSSSGSQLPLPAGCRPPFKKIEKNSGENRPLLQVPS
jgi:hypothetical protein